jgi:hypothetical protein
LNGILVNAPSALANTISSVIPGLTNLGVNAATQSALDAAAKTPVAGLDDIVVTAAKNTFPSSLFGSALQIPLPAAVSGAASDAANLEQDFDASFNQLLVEASRGVSVPDLIAKYGLEAVTAAGLVGGTLAATTGTATGAATPAATSSATTPGGLSEIVVTGTPKVAADLAALGPLSLGAVTTEEVAKAVAKQAAQAASATAAKPALSTIDKIRLGLAGAGLIGNAVEGTPGGKVPAGFGSSSQFNNPLPAANLPDSAARTAADMGMTSPQDWYRYGYGPEQSFMTGVPQGAKNTSTAFTGYKKGGSVSEALSYDNLSPEEKNFVDYHRRNLVVMPYEHDGGTTTIYGMQDDVPGGVMLHPGYIHGQMVDPQSRAARAGALDWAMRSGIDFPVYPDQATADTRETAIHRDIIEPDLQRYESGDRDWLQGYKKGGSVDADIAQSIADYLSSIHGSANVGSDYNSYDARLPVGRGALSVNASGSGLIPEHFVLGGEYPIGDATLYASDVTGDYPELGARFPLLGGDIDIATGGQPRRDFADRARISYRRDFAEGGLSVQGAGDGRSDSIDARLSDGEYVMDAETVALLGNGSNKAGAGKLDRLRVNIRKHKGRKLAKGALSADAKAPERYLAGGLI